MCVLCCCYLHKAYCHYEYCLPVHVVYCIFISMPSELKKTRYQIKILWHFRSRRKTTLFQCSQHNIIYLLTHKKMNYVRESPRFFVSWRISEHQLPKHLGSSYHSIPKFKLDVFLHQESQCPPIQTGLHLTYIILYAAHTQHKKTELDSGRGGLWIQWHNSYLVSNQSKSVRRILEVLEIPILEFTTSDSPLL